MTIMRTIDAEIIEAAKRRFGASVASVVRIVQRPDRWEGEMEPVVWYWLSVDGQLIGRRRTLAELLAWVESGRCQRSTRPVGTILGTNGGCQFGKTDEQVGTTPK